MFNPQDFFEFAKELRSCTFQCKEANQRTIISRLYYSSFLAIRELIGDKLANTPVELKYKELSENPYIHGAVDQIVNIADTFTRGLLHKMRINRNSADYKLLIGGLPLSLQTDQSFKLTKRLFEQRIPLLPSQIRRNIVEIESKVRYWHRKMEERQQP